MKRLTRLAEDRWVRRRDAEVPTTPAPANEQTTRPQDGPGWYPDPTMAGTQRYWDGTAWTEHVAPTSAAPPPSAPSNSQAYALVVVAGAVIGTIMAMQSASLLAGTGSNWTGVAIVIAAAVIGRLVRHSIPGWVRVVAIIAALLSLANVIYLENQLDQKRQEINQIIP